MTFDGFNFRSKYVDPEDVDAAQAKRGESERNKTLIRQQQPRLKGRIVSLPGGRRTPEIYLEYK